MSGVALDTRAAEHVLALADDEHLMGHRHSEWIGIAPFLEEDMAFASIGQDELGHAYALYELLTEDVEHLALRREPGEYRSCWLVEEPCRAWEDALVRHLLHDTAERIRWEDLTTSTHDGLRAVAARALREEDYHRRHATTLVERLLDATPESRERVVAALERLLPLGVALWEPTEGEEHALASGVATRPSEDLAAEWQVELTGLLGAHDVTLEWPEPHAGQHARTRRSPHFDEIREALTEVLRLDPEATW